ncbi:MFS transporter [Heyndrickxia sporothermodurans]|nr:MFS transporter [Heyndrickxia sporothermodurans]
MKNSFLPVIAAALGFFMALLDTTIVNVSLPKIADYYNTSIDQISWVVDSYNVAFGVILLTAARLADQFGRKRVFQIGLFLFIFSSLLCGLSQSIELLVIFRAVQGLAAAMIVPVSIPMVLVYTPSEKIGGVTALFGVMSGIAAASGPTLGGILSENFSWQWVFYINIPIGIVTILLVHLSIRESFDPTASKTIDWAGIVTLTIALFSLIYGLLKVQELGWSSTFVIVCLGCAIGGIILFILIEKKIKNPMFPMDLFKSFSFTSGTIAILFLGIGMMSVYFLMAFYLTSIKGISQVQAGLVLSSSSVATMMITPLAAKAYKWGTKWFGVFGFLVFGIGAYLLGNISLDASILVTVSVLLIIGVGSGMIFSPLSIALIIQAPEEKAGMASGLFQVSRAIGSAIGVAVLVVLLQHSMNDEMKLAKKEMMQKVEESSLLLETKGRIQQELSKISNHQTIQSISLNEVLNKIDFQKNSALKASPSTMHNQIEKQFEKEKMEMKTLFPKMIKTLETHLSSAFQFVFHLGSISLILGMIFAYFNGINSREMKQIISKKNFETGLD